MPEVEELQFTEDFFASVETEAKDTGNIMAVFGDAGVGKTTMFSHAPSPLLVQVKDESADVLIKSKQMESIPRARIKNWDNLIDATNQLATRKHSFKTIIYDGISGIEEMCNNDVFVHKCDSNTDTYTKWGYGDSIAAIQFLDFISAITKLKNRGLIVILLGHKELADQENPNGPSYSKYQLQLHKKKLPALRQYLDASLCIEHVSTYSNVADKGKASEAGKIIGTGARRMLCKDKLAYDIKNRLGLPAEIFLGASSKEAWNNFANEVAKSR